MSGSNSSGHAGTAPEALSFTVHSMPSPGADAVSAAHPQRPAADAAAAAGLRRAGGRVVPHLFRDPPAGPQTNYSELITPQRPIPPQLPLADLQGRPVDATSLNGQWILVVVAGAACDARCERHLWMQRQLRETLGRDKSTASTSSG